ncbi:MAG: type II toxin-antitoxin system Phd/YefM family antitoxin [Methylomonas sp.]|nr:type II toxin-antitoxin system Phd/YefM family antitoxin [Methylomonas sp.]PPD20516.1 MAG: type II toxin-antitoxin system prevent-host-death family antitoxin [Methylomonas sp.]PPD26805.1 MAG: type II toxin-antitoxin system prevent-host-death family antitoxin [Methylomonas sp.]PPD38669.1 MAG: type II toxin-antitoxin system prevent-host-death family antitoxin [Methylomonas sp.]PPD40802.1 MAG: type II toxin-antitoxin system prevent-host-death family antitoxin [Methylomonas sp.]
MQTITIQEAQTKLAQLVDAAIAGDEVFIHETGKPKIRLVPVDSVPTKRKLGIFAGKLTVPDDFDAQLPNDILDGFESS